MQPSGLSGWTPGQPTAVIDLGEEFAPDPSNASTAALQFSAAYYAVDSSAEGNGSKKRKVERACDFCRRRKARCDGPRMPDNVCSNCITNSRACTYLCVSLLRPLGRPSPSCISRYSQRGFQAQRAPEGVSDALCTAHDRAPSHHLTSYVVGLEDRVERMEALLKRVSISASVFTDAHLDSWFVSV